MYEYLKPLWEAKAPLAEVAPALPEALPEPGEGGTSLDRTAKLYIGGKQARPDGGYSTPVLDPKGALISEVGLGNRKDIRNAVEAAHKAAGWSDITGHQRAQVLYFLAENLEVRAGEFAARLARMSGTSPRKAADEVAASVARIAYYAAWADKWDGAARAPMPRMLALALNEPWGVMGISCPDEAPLLAFVSLAIPAIAMGNRIVITPSPRQPLAATDLYQVLDTSDVPDGVVNIVTGDRDQLAKTLAQHDDVASCWYVGSAEGSAMVERESAGNVKATWVNYGKARDWTSPVEGQGRDYLRRACQVKTIWTPYGA
jgi:aldehyde dehydrogenase (NAD+)